MFLLTILETRSLKPVSLGQNQDVSRAMLPPEALGGNPILFLSMTRCHWPKPGSTHPNAVKSIYWHRAVMKKSAAFIARCQARSPGQLMLKRQPKFPDGFQGSVFKAQVKEGSHKVCDQPVHWPLIGWWWGDRAVSQALTLAVLRLQ